LDIKISALVPVKSYSSRVPNKNRQLIGGASLFERKINQLKKSKYIDSIYVGSDSADILDQAEKFGAIPVIRDQLACDESISPANYMIEDFVNKVSCDIAVWAHCTNPFIYAEHYDGAIEKYLTLNYPYDSLVSVTKLQSHLWSVYGFPVNFNPNSLIHPLAKDLPPYYYQNGGIFIQALNKFKENSYFYGVHPFLYELEEHIGFDINTIMELELAQLVSKYLDGKYGLKN
jgi:N-acylneuraminate cytidylyltransferase